MTTAVGSPAGATPMGMRAAAIMLVAVVAAIVIAFGWDRGPDVLIDFGRELYVPWRLTLGEVLHRDIAWFNGPLGPWTLEAWMTLFGVSLDAVQALNAVVIVVTTALLGALLARIAGGVTAVVGSLVFLLVFAVAQQEEVGNFLFLSPYSHGITLGFAASIAALLALSRAIESRGRLAALAGGACAGLAFLTKAEMFLAAACGAAAMLGMDALTAPRPKGRLRPLLAFATGAALPIAAAYVRFVAELGSSEALHALLGTWPYAFDPRIGELKFYAAMRGTDDPLLHLARMARHTVASIAFVCLVGGAAGLVARRLHSRPATLALAFFGGCAATVAALTLVNIKWLLVPLPVVLVGLGLATLTRIRREAGSDPHAAAAPGGRARRLTQLGFVVFAGMLLPKVALLPLARQYGFVLAVPGTLLIVALLTRWGPRAAARRGWVRPAAEPALCAAGIGIALTFALANLNATRNWFSRKTVEFSEGGDRLWADGYRATVLNELARDLDARVPPDGTLLVLPEGILLNYVLRRRTPTRVVNFMPPELVFFEPAAIVAELESTPPDVVALIRRPTDIYGFPFFGEGYGEEILDWVRTHYRRVRLIGDEPLGPGPGRQGPFGAAILVPK